jgi:hypothetical protein
MEDYFILFPSITNLSNSFSPYFAVDKPGKMCSYFMRQCNFITFATLNEHCEKTSNECLVGIRVIMAKVSSALLTVPTFRIGIDLANNVQL